MHIQFAKNYCVCFTPVYLSEHWLAAVDVTCRREAYPDLNRCGEIEVVVCVVSYKCYRHVVVVRCVKHQLQVCFLKE